MLAYGPLFALGIIFVFVAAFFFLNWLFDIKTAKYQVVALIGATAITVLFILSAFRLNYQYEKFVWNNGICAKYDEPWQYYSSSLFAKGYCCRNEYIWIETDVDARYPLRTRRIPSGGW